MRFFTKQWLSGGLSDDEYEATPDAYWRHVSSLQLPPDVLALSQFNPHDARILDVSSEPHAGRLTLRLRCGDLQCGYHQVQLAYSEARIDDASLKQLHCATTLPFDEILYDEVDRAGERFEHRFIFASKAEISISFGSITITPLPLGGGPIHGPMGPSSCT